MPDVPFPPLPADFEPTRATLHAYAHGVGSIARAHGTSHPKWWHLSLKVRPRGLTTDALPLPGGGSADLRMDLTRHEVVLETSRGERRAVSMHGGLTGTEFGDELIAAAAAVGLEGEYARAKFESDEPRSYDPAVARGFFDALVNVELVMQEQRAALAGELGPAQVWPHGFDLAFEWFGTRVEAYEEGGETGEQPSQLNFGFYPAGRAYFYCNPWPFEGAKLLGSDLPSGAEWHTEGWEGSILHYDQLAGEADAAARLRAYWDRVHELAAPTLTAD